MIARRRLANPAGLFVVALLVVGALGAGVSAPAADARSEQDCEIPRDKPLKITVREGRQVTVDCVSGNVKVTEGPRKSPTGRRGTGPAPAADEDYEESILVPDGYTPEPDEGGEAYTGQATCVVDSKLFDNHIANIIITRERSYLAWRWNADKNKIRRTAAVYSRQNWFLPTHWSRDHDRGDFLYEPTLNNKGKWTKQGHESWQDFSINGLYHHEHHIIEWVDAAGGCRGENYFFGTIPGQGYQTFESYKDPYERGPN